ncbi:unnamed protein product [Amoebophrya sp. A120]|nr:unnamed protein product [Amoebophrya sp. A120]|eukprot:GSA120T00002671001.1
MKFLNGGDISFLDLEKIMFEGGTKKVGHNQKRRKVQQHTSSSSSHMVHGPYTSARATAPPLAPNLQQGGATGSYGPSSAGPSSSSAAQAAATAAQQAQVHARFEVTVVVHGVPRVATYDDVKNYFEQKCGKVIDVKFVPGNNSLVCVQFEEMRAMNKAVSGLANPEILGVPVRVRPSLEVREELQNKPRRQVMQEFPTTKQNEHPRHSRKIRITNVHVRATTSDMYKLFQPFGDIESTTLRGDGACDLSYRNVNSATDATIAMNGFQYLGEALQIVQASETPLLRAANPPPPPLRG